MQFRTRPFRAFLFALLLFVFWDRHQKCLKCFPAVYSLSKMANLQPPSCVRNCKLRHVTQSPIAELPGQFLHRKTTNIWIANCCPGPQDLKATAPEMLLKTAKKLTSSGDKKPWCKDLSFHFLDACVSTLLDTSDKCCRTISVLKWVRVCMVPTYVWSSNPFQYFQGYLYNRYTVI